MIVEWMSLEQWRNNPDRWKIQYSEENLVTVPLCPQKSHMEWPGIETGPLQWVAGIAHSERDDT
jgi:hypothetical protein